LGEVANRVARMGAQWMAAGFVHGVLNSDNINITGESFDYGPWRFLPTYDPEFTAAYFDQGGRYAYGRQPGVLLWNLSRLAECLETFAATDELTARLQGFQSTIQSEFAAAVVRRLGLVPRAFSEDMKLANELFSFLRATNAPFEQIFFDLHGGLASESRWERKSRRVHLSRARIRHLARAARRVSADAGDQSGPSLLSARCAVHDADRRGHIASGRHPAIR